MEETMRAFIVLILLIVRLLQCLLKTQSQSKRAEVQSLAGSASQHLTAQCHEQCDMLETCSSVCLKLQTAPCYAAAREQDRSRHRTQRRASAAEVESAKQADVDCRGKEDTAFARP
jgi:hypothetical protein